MKLYGVVTMDLVGSRNLKNRSLVQSRLSTYIASLNEKYKQVLPAPITITLGDEWQLITNTPWEVYNLVTEFQQLLWQDQIEFYAGLGIGEITTAISKDMRQMDGPCFHLARQALEIAKIGPKGKEKRVSSKNNRVYFSPLELPESLHNLAGDQTFLEVAATHLIEDSLPGQGLLLNSELINVLIENTEILKANLTPKQKKVYIDYIKLGSYRKMVEMNEEARETIGGISQKLNKGQFFTIQRNQKTIFILLKYYSELMRGLV